jgi:enoyl-CoA hydratase/carnithine racemase
VATLVRLEHEDGIGIIRLDRPPMNVINRPMQDQLRAVAIEVAERDDIAAVVIYGGPRVFAAGADIKEMAQMSYVDMVSASHGLMSAVDAVARIPKPVVAAIAGYALGGGCELALAADRRIAAATAKLGQPEIKLGVIPGAGGTQRLARLVGPAHAKELIFTGKIIDADEARSIGLVDVVVEAQGPADAEGASASGEQTAGDAGAPEPDPEQAGRRAFDAARAWARQFVGGPAQALRAAKAAIDRGLDVDLATGLEIERQNFAALFATEDRKIGMSAFVNKTTPEFTGR